MTLRAPGSASRLRQEGPVVLTNSTVPTIPTTSTIHQHCQPQPQSYLVVIIGIVDTGLDYRKPAF